MPSEHPPAATYGPACSSPRARVARNVCAPRRRGRGRPRDAARPCRARARRARLSQERPAVGHDQDRGRGWPPVVPGEREPDGERARDERRRHDEHALGAPNCYPSLARARASSAWCGRTHVRIMFSGVDRVIDEYRGCQGDRRSCHLPRRQAHRRARHAGGTECGLPRRGGHRVDWPLPPRRTGVCQHRTRVRAARARGRGRRQGAPAFQARAVRRHALSRPATRSLHRRDRDRRVRRGARIRRSAVRHHRPPRRGTGSAPRSPQLEARPELLSRGPFAIVHAILDRVVDDYAPVIAGIENDIDEIEDDVFEPAPQSRGAFTSSLARWSSSSARPSRCRRSWTG